MHLLDIPALADPSHISIQLCLKYLGLLLLPVLALPLFTHHIFLEFQLCYLCNLTGLHLGCSDYNGISGIGLVIMLPLGRGHDLNLVDNISARYYNN